MRTRVLSHPSRVSTPKQTVQMLIDSLPEDVEIVDFTWRAALLGSWDVLHVHWLEILGRGGSPVRSTAKAALITLLVARLRVLQRPFLWTVHNEHPHEPSSRVERWSLHRLLQAVTWRVFMYSSVIPPALQGSSSLIPRGDYAPAYEDLRTAAAISRPARSLLLFGMLRPYKGVETLIDAFAGLRGTRTLDIAGRPLTPQYGRSLTDAVAGAERVRLTLTELPDAELAALVQRSDVVVLPYTEMYNSGVALLGLYLGRPLVVPASATMRELRDEVGEQWVHLFEGTLDSATLEVLLQRIDGEDRPTPPTFADRDWVSVGRRYAALYHELAEPRGAR